MGRPSIPRLKAGAYQKPLGSLGMPTDTGKETLMRAFLIGCIVVLGGAFAFAADEAPKAGTKVLNDFEVDADKDMFADSTADISISTEHATSGKHSLKAVWTGAKPLSAIGTLPADWSEYKWLKFDLFMEGESNFTLRLKDKAGKSYDVWQYPAQAGANTITVNLETAGGTIDLKQIFHFFFYLVDDKETATGYVDNLRLEK